MSAEAWTVKRALEWTEGYLGRKGDESPRASAQWLLCEACGLSRVQLYTDGDRPLSREELDTLHEWVARRAAGEPLQYITGEVAFRYVTLKVARGVLIPRPETEVLVSEGIAALRAVQKRQDAAAWDAFVAEAAERARAVEAARAEGVDAGHRDADDAGRWDAEGAGGLDVDEAGRWDADDAADAAAAVDGMLLNVERFEPPAFEPLVVDVCTGSGCIACSVASELPGAKVIATDIAPEAVQLARENAQALGVDERVKVLACDLGAGVPDRFEGRIDLVISNPPYVPSGIMGEIPSEVRDFEPALALDGGADGLDVFRRLVPFAVRFLRPGGTLAVELHEVGMDRAVAIAEEGGLCDVRVVKDLAGRPRVLVAQRPEERAL
ncbi:MAG TPA: peptide chain release factor N(5)-glutamine methyltransferase [Candidatus Aveggerthella excrementigallinarum]|nr:peptide chain release factor N(5)-glutamine methyltransferase [Candidatus Aveggerthella excrementigallinarum]